MKNRKMGLYRFVTTFCLFPVSDWGAILQRVTSEGIRAFLFWLLINVLTKPMFFVGLIFLLTWMPDTIGWIFLKLGEIGLSVAFLVMNALMPDVFMTGSGEYRGWAAIWSEGLNVLPADAVDVMNSIGVAQVLGMVISTAFAVFSIRIIRRIMNRAGKI